MTFVAYDVFRIMMFVAHDVLEYVAYRVCHSAGLSGLFEYLDLNQLNNRPDTGTGYRKMPDILAG